MIITSTSNVVRVPRSPELVVTNAELALAVTEEHATFEIRDVIRTTARAARQGASLDHIVSRADEFMASDQAVAVAPGRWTTPEMLELEGRVVDLASGPSHAEYRARADVVAAAVAARPSLSVEQAHMVEELTLSGRPVEVVIGQPGTGKTFSLDAVRDAFEASGHRVIGVSLAARAARELQAGSGIVSTTAHALDAAVDSGRVSLRAGDVLVVDEAGMLGTRLMAALAGEAERAGAKMILVGDPKQLPAVAAGGLLAALAQRVEVVSLVENHRQRDPEERLVTAALREGRAELAVRRLDEHGHVTLAHNSDDLRDQMVLDWWNHRAVGADVVMGTVGRADARDLNRRAHDVLEASGQLGPEVAVVDQARFCVGDRVLGHKNRYDLGILNGELGEIAGGDQAGLRVHLAVGT